MGLDAGLTDKQHSTTTFNFKFNVIEILLLDLKYGIINFSKTIENEVVEINNK